ncbi:DUF5615 family PIN-like protein [Crocosphaera chwakensis]|uniref:DUF5615 domain-containing protein n=1 Tax=Crocosphaera chwakensis CCY0110 TaxID=391612 RepID=A3IMA2_9CHRO|nr:DUF5615 family PIN-like protein [Crocosphaera chwakensis]EAZ92271.1 hypothetical protein CY0110_27969 [Crocosphaera chwakensis CCY0110]
MSNLFDRIKFHLDENVENAIAEGLRRRNIDVTTTAEVNLIGASDEQQNTFALTQKRVIFTHDADFLRFHQQQVEHAGIIYCRQGRRSIGEILQALWRIYLSQTTESMYHRLEFI